MVALVGPLALVAIPGGALAAAQGLGRAVALEEMAAFAAASLCHDRTYICMGMMTSCKPGSPSPVMSKGFLESFMPKVICSDLKASQAWAR